MRRIGSPSVRPLHAKSTDCLTVGLTESTINPTCIVECSVQGCRVYSQSMRAILKITAIVLSMLAGTLPQLACVVPGTELAANEMECCKNAAGDCGPQNVPMLDCCKIVVRATPSLSASSAQETASPESPVSIISFAPFVLPAISAHRNADLDSSNHARPPDPYASLILRI